MTADKDIKLDQSESPSILASEPKAVTMNSLLFVLALTISGCIGSSVLKFEKAFIKDETEFVMELMGKNVVPERFKAASFLKKWGIKSKLTSYQFKDCGGPNAIAKISTLTVSPDPISLPGTMNITANAVISNALQSPLKTNLTIEKKIGNTYVKIPCIGDFGSCVYDDLCDILYGADCPGVLTKNGIPCTCPFKAKTYTLPTSPFDAESLYFPGGDYHLIGQIFQSDKLAGCIDVYLSIKAS